MCGSRSLISRIIPTSGSYIFNFSECFHFYGKIVMTFDTDRAAIMSPISWLAEGKVNIEHIPCARESHHLVPTLNWVR